MPRVVRIVPEFVEFVPKQVKDGVLYISEEYETASHNCACGCGLRVVTPLTETDWSLQRDGGMVSLFPSIGNWDYPCKSHYWISHNNIVWAEKWSRAEVEGGREADRRRKEAYYRAPTPGTFVGKLQELWTRVISWLTRSGK